MRFLAVLTMLVGTTAIPAAESRLFGGRIMRGDYVGGSVTYARGRSVIIDLGYAHGVVPGHDFLAFRRQGTYYRLVSKLRIGTARRKTSFGSPVARAEIRTGDIVMIAASKLMIWHGRRDWVGTNSLRRRFATRGDRVSDTGDDRIDRDDLFELSSRNQSTFKQWRKELDDYRPGGPALWDTSAMRERRVEFHRHVEAHGGIIQYRSLFERNEFSYGHVVHPIDATPLDPATALGYDPPVAADPATEAAPRPAAPGERASAPTRADLPRVMILAQRLAVILRRNRPSP